MRSKALVDPMQSTDGCPRLFERPHVQDHVIRQFESLVTTCLRGEYAPGLFDGLCVAL